MARAVVFGGTGMVGRNLLRSRMSANFDVLAPSRSEVDCEDQTQVLDYLLAHEPSFVVNCAGLVGGIKENSRNQANFLLRNLSIGKNILLAATNLREVSVLNISSSCMYSTTAPQPFKESDICGGPFEPTNEGYALAKYSICKLGEYLSNTNSNVSIKTVIPCNLYGLFDNFDLERGHLIASAMLRLYKAAVEKDDHVDIWGSGKPKREFMYCADLADAIWFLLGKFDELPMYLNVGSGDEYSVVEYYEIIKRVMGISVEIRPTHDGLDGMSRKIMDSSTVRRLGWNPDTNIYDGIAKTYKYFLERVHV